MDDLELGKHLIVAADFSPKEHGGITGVRERVMTLARSLEGTEVIIKLNSILRACGYGLIKSLRELGLKVMADLKLVDIPNTMETDGEMLAEVKPELVTVMCNAGIKGMMALQKALGGKTEVLGVTVLTSLDEEDCQAIFACSTKAGVLRFARMAQLSGVGGLILSPNEVAVLKKRGELALSCNTPGIRPEWAIVEGDDQSRVMTPKKAIVAGAKRIVVGRPITLAKPNSDGKPANPKEAVQRTLEEITAGIEELRRKKEAV